MKNSSNLFVCLFTIELEVLFKGRVVSHGPTDGSFDVFIVADKMPLCERLKVNLANLKLQKGSDICHKF